MGSEPVPLLGAVRGALQQVLPWVPITLAVIVLAARFPFSRERWPRYALMHLVAAAVLLSLIHI